MLGTEHPHTLTSMSNLAGSLDSQGKYEEAEAMNRQTLAWRENILGTKHPDTLFSVYCLAHFLANRCRYHDSLALYDRACAMYSVVLGEDHPTTRACCQHRPEALAWQEQFRVVISPATPDNIVIRPASKVSILSRGLAKLGI